MQEYNSLQTEHKRKHTSMYFMPKNALLGCVYIPCNCLHDFFIICTVY